MVHMGHNFVHGVSVVIQTCTDAHTALFWGQWPLALRDRHGRQSHRR